MGRKKKKQLKPWCWYCNREFDDEKILIQHQKSKHFKCTFCHKKLYTGPGLSIHSMQVHKEKIDKIPFALPQRCNVDLEIYGMEGIPDEDIKEHERHKAGKEDEVDEKRIKLEFPPILPHFPLHNMPMTNGLQYMPSMSLPVMPPPLPFGLAPPIFVTRPTSSSLLPNSMTAINPIGSISQNHPISTPTVTNCPDQKDNNNIPPPPPPPPVKVEDTIQKSTSQTAIFLAYSISTEAAKVISKVAQPTSSTPNVKVILVHPEDDLPLEQIRLRLPKYSTFLTPIKSTSTDLSWIMSSQQNQLTTHSETKMIPPPPPPNQLQIHQHISNCQFERPLSGRPWIAPHIVQFTKPLNFGGQGYY